MSTEKIIITQRLRNDIIEKRKTLSMSAYDLSERSGHSKFWLSNIESGKTKKISKDDILSIYKVIYNTDDVDEVIFYIEDVLNQQVGSEQKHWYELINISESFSENYDNDELMEILEHFLEDDVLPKIRNIVFGMSVNQKQAALTAIQNFYNSLYKNPELTFALINIPIYGVSSEKERETALSDLLAISAKYNDLVIKNKSLESIESQKDFEVQFERYAKEIIQEAFYNFKRILSQILRCSKNDEPDLHELVNNFIHDVTFLIERGQPNVTKHYLKSFHIHTGKDFIQHIRECYNWFIVFYTQYDIQNLHSIITPEFLNSVYEYLDTIKEIKPTMK